jgi:mono/diheme cytochrome c family protein
MQACILTSIDRPHSRQPNCLLDNGLPEGKADHMSKLPPRAKLHPSAMFCGVLALAMTLLVTPLIGQEAEDEENKFDYTVVDDRVDESTLMGFSVYTGTCAACHGPDGMGSSVAPSLIRAAERRTFEQFAQTVAEGRSLLPGMVMPSFAGDMRVMTHLQDIWNYLGARAEGGLGRGRPQLLEAEEETDG